MKEGMPKVETTPEQMRKIEIENRITELGSQLHDEWRKPRWREESKDYEPRVKKTKDAEWSKAHGGATEVDIANTKYEELPSDWQGENKISAEIAVNEVERALGAGIPLDGSFVEAASSTLHEKWLERNGSWAPPEQNKPYSELSEEEKKKDRDIIKIAIENNKFHNWEEGLKKQTLESLEDQESYIEGRGVSGRMRKALYNEIDRKRKKLGKQISVLDYGRD